MAIDILQLKQQAADQAVAAVTSGMILGLGTGSTALLAVRRLAELLAKGQLRDIRGVPTSSQIEQEARRLNIPLTTLEVDPVLDLTIDGADEVDPALNLIKGGGGALLREKIVAQASRREIIIVDESKLSPVLGTRWAVPVEVIEFGWRTQWDYLSALGAQVTVRQRNGVVFKTDQGNLILDANFGPLTDATTLAARLNARVGVVEHGLFLGLASEVIVAGAAGIQHLTRQA
ncbi:MAG: ribose-5-phosphate isomerase RpiA [Chloroflexi bacterium]|nr:ribose-5-phosphate isomerase RpiA [Chloroflexota bacterium]